jgi:hypothetical protein
LQRVKEQRFARFARFPIEIFIPKEFCRIIEFVDDRFAVQTRPASKDHINLLAVDKFPCATPEDFAARPTVSDDRYELDIRKLFAGVDLLDRQNLAVPQGHFVHAHGTGLGMQDPELDGLLVFFPVQQDIAGLVQWPASDRSSQGCQEP